MKLNQITLIIALFTFIACSKNEPKVENTPSIVNTIWEESGSIEDYSLQFNENTAKLTKTNKWTPGYSSFSIWTYTYEYPKITFHPTTSGQVTLYGNISGIILTIENPTITQGSKIIYTLYKK
jgi:hypothetical protein